MSWDSIADGRLQVYKGPEGTVRIRQAGPTFPLDDPPLGTAWVVDGLLGPDAVVLLEVALVQVVSLAVGETWLCSPEEVSLLPADRRVVAAWPLWQEAHPEHNWVGNRVRVD